VAGDGGAAEEEVQQLPRARGQLAGPARRAGRPAHRHPGPDGDGGAGGTYGAATFSFWLEIKTNDPASKASDTLTVQVLDASGTVVKQTLHVYSNQDAVGHYVQHSFSLNSFLGQTIVLKFTGAQTLTGHSTSFFIDDTALNAS
jgi:hypothetical protein